MENLLTASITTDQLVVAIGILLLLYGFYKKFWPDVVSKVHKDDQTDRLDKRLSEVERTAKKLEDEVAQLKQETKSQQKYIEDSTQERAIMMRALLAALKGLQELGVNGPTHIHESEVEITNYLNDKAHSLGPDEH